MMDPFQLGFCCYCKIVFCLFVCSTNYFYFLLSDSCRICKAVVVCIYALLQTGHPAR